MVEFAGFPDNKLIPGTKRKLNGVHRWTFGYLYRGDLKRKYGAAGAKAFNSTYLPRINLTLNGMKSLFPNCKLNPDKWRSHEQQVDAFTAQEYFRQSQKVKLNAEIEKIYQNKNFSDEDKLKKSTAASSQLVKAEARKFETLQGFPVAFNAIFVSLLHFMPYLMAQLMFCALCFLHLDCNEWKQVFDRLLSTSCDATLEEFPE